jgi:hypothetical protein
MVMRPNRVDDSRFAHQPKADAGNRRRSRAMNSRPDDLPIDSKG